MTSHQGQTDQVVKVKLESRLALARWLDASVAANGEAGLEVATVFVGQGAPIKIQIKDGEGRAVGALEGQVQQNWFRARYKPGANAANKLLFFEAELPKHSLKMASGALKVGPAVEITQLKWMDKGKEAKEVEAGAVLDLEASLKGVPDGTQAVISVHARKTDHGRSRVLESAVAVKDGKVKTSWTSKLPGGEGSLTVQHELEKLGLEYFQPLFTFEVSCLGATAESKPVQLVSWVAFEFGPAAAGEKRTAVFEMPDGKEKKETVPEDGNVKVTAAMPGRILFKGFEE